MGRPNTTRSVAYFDARSTNQRPSPIASEYDVERKFRETRLLLVAPVSNNLVLAYLGQNVLGMPRSY